MNYYTYDLERTIERKEKDCANEDEKAGYTDATLDLTRYKKEIEEFTTNPSQPVCGLSGRTPRGKPAPSNHKTKGSEHSLHNSIC